MSKRIDRIKMILSTYHPKAPRLIGPLDRLLMGAGVIRVPLALFSWKKRALVFSLYWLLTFGPSGILLLAVLGVESGQRMKMILELLSLLRIPEISLTYLVVGIFVGLGMSWGVEWQIKRMKLPQLQEIREKILS